MLHIISDPKADGTDMAVTMVETQVYHEVKELSLERDNFSTPLDYEKASRYVGSTILDLFG